MTVKDEFKTLVSHVFDLASRAENGRPASTGFLTPEEAAVSDSYLRSCGLSVRYRFYGGYPEAERKILVLFPDYAECDDFDTDKLFVPVFIRSSGYIPLNHSSYLGALMNLGIERSALGDIALVDGGAVVFALPKIADFLLSCDCPLERVGRDKVKLSVSTPELLSKIKREFTELSFTLASPRVDCLAAELTGLSRERAKELVINGELRLNYIVESNPSAHLSPGDTVSVKGYGKIIVRELQTTRKNRIRVSALRYT